MLKTFTTAAIVISSTLTASALAEPEIFSAASFTEDQSAATEAGKVQIAYFTATWCPPCKKMKAETWVDEDVVDWAEEHAVISAVDVDENGQLAREFRARSIPTIVFLVEGEEVARTVGYQSPDRFLGWLEDNYDKHASELAPMTGGVKPAPSSAPSQERVLMSADEVVTAYDTALRKDQSGLGVTGSVLVPRMRELASQNEAFRQELEERVQSLRAKIDEGSFDAQSLREYLQLAPLTGTAEDAAQWIESQLETQQGRAILEKSRYLVQDLLAQTGRYDEAAAFVEDPVRQARQMIAAASRGSVVAMRDMESAALREFKEGQSRLLDRNLADLIAVSQTRGESAKAKAIARLFGEDKAKAQEAVNQACESAGVEPVEVE